MRILVVAVGTRMPQWVVSGFDDYAMRMPRDLRIELVEVKPEKRLASSPAERVQERERERMESALPPGCVRVALDEHGRAFDSSGLARQLAQWRAQARDLAFLIGGTDGLSASAKAGASMLLSLSPLTLPHGLARVVLVEQLYRAHTILAGHPYHRA